MAENGENVARRTINFTPGGEAALQALMQFYPGRPVNTLVNRALEVWQLMEDELTVNGKITYQDREGDIVGLRIFP
jgi:hypothetical protein